MAGNTGDLIQIVDNQTYLGIEGMNVYYYRITSPTPLVDPYLEEIYTQWANEVLTPVLDFQNNDVLHTTTVVRNLTNNLDFYEENVNVQGSIALALSARAPSFVSVGFKLIRESLATRNGYKRYWGLDEGAMGGNIYTFPVGVQAAVEDGLAADLISGIVTLAEPVIVRRPIVPPVAPGYVYASIGSAQYAGTMGTQNTRKT